MKINGMITLVCVILGFHSCDEFLLGLAEAYNQNQQRQMMYKYGRVPPYPGVTSSVPYFPPVPSATYIPSVPSGSYGSSSVYSESSNSSSSSTRNCQRCMGTGNCQTCNGRGYYDNIGIGSGRQSCPNCASNHNGRCASCNGTGRM